MREAPDTARSAAFIKRTAQLYRSMQNRVAEKRDKRQRIIRVGRALAFTLEDFRTEILSVYGAENKARLCRYCSRPLSVLTFSPEHRVPLKRGGDLSLSNLDLEVCLPCNHRKGGLKAEEFQALLDGLKTFPEAARTDILSRLEIAIQLAGANRFRLSQNNRGQQAPSPAQPQAASAVASTQPSTNSQEDF